MMEMFAGMAVLSSRFFHDAVPGGAKIGREPNVAKFRNEISQFLQYSFLYH